MRSFYLTVLVCALTLTSPGFGQGFDVRKQLEIPDNIDFQVALSGPNVYVVWAFYNLDENMWNLNLGYSNDGGNTFDVRVLYRVQSGGVFQPQIAASGDTAHVVFYLGSSQGYIYYCPFRADEDFPCRERFNVNPPRHNFADNLRIAASGNNVYIAWNDLVFAGNVYLNGTNLTNDEDTQNRRRLTDLVATGNDVYLRWNLREGGTSSRPFLMHVR